MPRVFSFSSAQGAALLETARARLPVDAERRSRDLRTLQEEDRLSPDDRAELLALVDRVEREDAERAGAILALARLRNVPVNEVLRELRIATRRR